MQKHLFMEKLREAMSSVLPIVTIVAVLCLIWIPVQTDLMLAFLIGSFFLVLGMSLFSMGADMSMSPIGTHIGAALTRSRNIRLILIVAFLLGAAVTIAEPDLTVLADNVPAIDTTLLILIVSAGVGLFLLLSMVRILHAIPLRLLLAGQPAGPVMAARHLMPEVEADEINSALFDEIGDSVVECEGGTLTLIEDYREDVARILGGNA